MSELDTKPTVEVVNNLVTSLIRTVVPVVIGSLLAVVIKHFPGAGGYLDEAKIDAWLIPLVISFYYTVVRTLEAKYPNVGWLLGVPKSPGYAQETPPPAQPAPDDESTQGGAF